MAVTSPSADSRADVLLLSLRVIVAALDFFSPAFDPLLALNTPGLRPPIPDVKPLITVQMCGSLLPDDHIDYKPPKPATQHIPAAKPMSAEHPAESHAKLPATTNPLTVFSTAARVPPPLSTSSCSSPPALAVGPLSLLQSLVATQQRCRVLLRSHHSLHSILTGQLRAFDRHCNLYIVEAHQTQRTTAQLTVTERQRHKHPQAAGSGRRWRWVDVERRVGVWQREWVGQMMIRGECVISVSRCSDTSEAADAQITGIERDSSG